MHIEPGVVQGAKLILGYVTATAAMGVVARYARDTLRASGVLSLCARSLLAAALTFCCFELLPHHPVGVSEVHLILGTTLLLVFGTAAAALGLAGGLLAQGLFFAPTDLPQLGMNLTTLLVPLFATAMLLRRIVPPQTAWVDLGYAQVLKLSAAYQGGIVAWVAFWTLWGQGFAALGEIAAFAAAYAIVLVAEPLIDLAVLAAAKSARQLRDSSLLERRLFAADA